MRKQPLLILFFIAGLSLLEACDDFFNPGCGDVTESKPYFDFGGLKASYDQNVQGEVIRFVVNLDSVDYVAQASPAPRWDGITTAAYGCDVAPPGYLGAKFPISSINITANKPYNDSLAAGVSLSNLFQRAQETFYSVPEAAPLASGRLTSLKSLDTYPPFPYGSEGYMLLLTKEAPTQPGPFVFTITFVKSDSSTVSVVTPEISF